MAQIMARILEAPNSSYKTGLALGQGIGSTLQGLAAGKAREIQVSKLEQAYQRAGLNPALAMLPEAVQKNYVSQMLRDQAAQNFERDLFGGALQPGGVTPSGLNALAGLEAQQAAEGMATSGMPSTALGATRVAPTGVAPTGVAPTGVAPTEVAPTGVGGLKAPSEPMGTPTQPTPQEQGLQRRVIQEGGIPEFGGRTASEVRQAARRLTPDQQKVVEDRLQHYEEIQERRRLHEENLALAERKAGEKEKAARFKETKEERKEIIEKARAARQSLHDLERMEELEKTGKLDTPGYVEFLKRAGFDLPALTNPESEEFQKIAANFLRDIKTYFPGRVSNYEVENFLKTIPSLSQSPEGRKRVIANLKYLNRGALEYNNALKEVMAKNKGIPPYDLLEQVDDAIGNKLDKLSDKFKEDLTRPVPPAQNRLVTALQTALGSLAGFPGKLLGKVAGALGSGASAGVLE